MIENYMAYFDLCVKLYASKDKNFDFFAEKLQVELDNISVEDLPRLLECLESKNKILFVDKHAVMSRVMMYQQDKGLADRVPTEMIESDRQFLDDYSRIQHFYSEALNQVNSMVSRNNNVR